LTVCFKVFISTKTKFSLESRTSLPRSIVKCCMLCDPWRKKEGESHIKQTHEARENHLKKMQRGNLMCGRIGRNSFYFLVDAYVVVEKATGISKQYRWVGRNFGNKSTFIIWGHHWNSEWCMRFIHVCLVKNYTLSDSVQHSKLVVGKTWSSISKEARKSNLRGESSAIKICDFHNREKFFILKPQTNREIRLQKSHLWKPLVFEFRAQ
jgi:hypothetical protein